MTLSRRSGALRRLAMITSMVQLPVWTTCPPSRCSRSWQTLADKLTNRFGFRDCAAAADVGRSTVFERYWDLDVVPLQPSRDQRPEHHGVG